MRIIITNEKGEKREILLTILLIVTMLLFGMWMSFLTPEISEGQTYNETAIVNTTVNITNAAPIVTSIVLDSPVDLTAYATKTVYCNLTVFDFDNDTLEVNATLYIDGVVQADSFDDGNNHYTNGSCALISPQDMTMNYTCAFEVEYYADNTTQWICNVTVADNGAGQSTSSNESNHGTINPLVAIKLPTILDYGDLAVGDISPDTLANVTNAGNRDANISVEGWAETPGDGNAFNCSFGTIDLSYERYNSTAGSLFGSMTQLTSNPVLIPDFYVPQRVSPTSDSVNSTYWKVQIPVGAGGVCHGKILFSASDRTG